MALHKSLCFFMFLVTLISSTHARTFKVGGKNGWTTSPSENYNSWAGRLRFLINDTLHFKYDALVDPMAFETLIPVHYHHNHPWYNSQLSYLYSVFLHLLEKMQTCLAKMGDDLNFNLKFKKDRGWDEYFSILSLLHYVAQKYEGLDSRYLTSLLPPWGLVFTTCFLGFKALISVDCCFGLFYFFVVIFAEIDLSKPTFSNSCLFLVDFSVAILWFSIHGNANEGIRNIALSQKEGDRVISVAVRYIICCYIEILCCSLI
nr:early nodulin-like protein 2 [Tanacetum cinerariifolium]